MIRKKIEFFRISTPEHIHNDINDVIVYSSREILAKTRWIVEAATAA